MSPSPGHRRKPSKVPTLFLLLALSFCVQCLLSSSQGRMKRWRAARGMSVQEAAGGLDGGRIWIKRKSEEQAESEAAGLDLGESAAHNGQYTSYPLPHSTTPGHTSNDSSHHLATDSNPPQGIEDDAGSGTMLNIDYQGWYDSLSPAWKPFALGLLVLWAFTLFATIGITASDFFCPNLATVADRLGMNESTAGVTFLAFGNGSPDVFSTFSALSSGSFSLAIGELLGASTFIVSVVIGSMALVQPFHVPRWPFIRDVGFFTIAVSILVACLADGKLTLWESGGLVGMYVGYVGVVVGGNWVAGRRSRRKERAMTMDDQSGGMEEWLSDEEEEAEDEITDLAGSRSIFTNDGELEDATSRTQSRPGLSTRSRATTMTSQDGRSPSLLPSRRASLTRQQSHTKGWPQRPGAPDTPRPHFSLLGAIEFRDAVNALRKESAAAAAAEAGETLPTDGRLTPQIDHLLGEPAMEEYFGAISPFTSGHYHSHGPSQASSGSKTPRSRAVSPGLSRLRSSSHVATGRNPHGMSPLSEAMEGTTSRPPTFGRAITVANVSAAGPARKAVSLHDIRRASAGVVDHIGTPSIGVSPATPPAEGDAVKQTSLAGGASSTSSGHEFPLHLTAPDASAIQASDNSTHLASPPDQNTTESDTMVGNDETEDHRSYDMAGVNQAIRRNKRTRAMNTLWAVLHTLFPSMHGFWTKSFAGMFLAVLASPAILALTLTLPVVDDCAEGLTLNMGGIALHGDEGESPDLGHAENGHAGTEEEAEIEDERHMAGEAGRELHHLAMTAGLPSPSDEHIGMKGLTREPSAIEDFIEDQHEHLLYNNYLVAAQCVFGTLFCAYAIFSGLDWGFWAMLGLGLGGVVLAAAVLLYGEDGHDPLWRLLRCFAGFFAAMVWISAIADEMVQVLLTFGVILGLSEAIIGLTIFAIGASMADLISNLTVAKIAPAMSHAACYGGPLLNCLLGIGGAGTYAGLTTNRAYPVHFSHTLWVSAIGLIFILISTLIYVPWNGYYISRSWAVFLIGVYVVLTTINIIVEISA